MSDQDKPPKTADADPKSAAQDSKANEKASGKAAPAAKSSTGSDQSENPKTGAGDEPSATPVATTPESKGGAANGTVKGEQKASGSSSTSGGRGAVTAGNGGSGSSTTNKRGSDKGGSDKKPGKNASAGNGSGGKGGWGKYVLWLVLLLLVAGAMVAGGQYLLQELERRDQQAAAQAYELQNQLEAARQELDRLARQQQQLQRQQQEQAEELAQQSQQQVEQVRNQVDERLNDIERTLNYQSERLRALSTTSREDWLLAEAEYLLKLANQRMIIERSTEAAVALLQEADQILRSLEDPQLMPLRRALARDLTELKLAAQVDLEGIYLRLASLAENVYQLPTQPPREPPHQQGGQQQSESAGDQQSWWQGAWSTFTDMFDDLGSYIRVRDHAEQPQAILPPEAGEYLKQNLRMMLERAQLAAMRQESELYEQTLQNVETWARRFYPESQQLENFLDEVRELAAIEVQQDLPDISESLQMLGDYIDRLHRLGGANNGAQQQEAQ